MGCYLNPYSEVCLILTDQFVHLYETKISSASTIYMDLITEVIQMLTWCFRAQMSDVYLMIYNDNLVKTYLTEKYKKSDNFMISLVIFMRSCTDFIISHNNFMRSHNKFKRSRNNCKCLSLVKLLQVLMKISVDLMILSCDLVKFIMRSHENIKILWNFMKNKILWNFMKKNPMNLL